MRNTIRNVLLLVLFAFLFAFIYYKYLTRALNQKIAIYTVVTGDYEAEVLYNPVHLKFINAAYYVTDSKKLAGQAESMGWIVIMLKESDIPKKTQRRLKITQHLSNELQILNQCDIVIYHDGNSVMKSENLLRKVSIIFFQVFFGCFQASLKN